MRDKEPSIRSMLIGLGIFLAVVFVTVFSLRIIRDIHHHSLKTQMVQNQEK